MLGGNTQSKPLTPKPPTSGTARPVQQRKKGATDKEILAGPSDLNKKVRVSVNLKVK
jgi:hypothetical protein